MTDKTGDIMRTYTSEQLVPSPTAIKWDQEAEVLCSYSWQEHKIGTSVIFVPGAPPKWSPLPLPRSIPMDISYTLVDHNHVRQPNYPYHPMFKALEIMNPCVSLSDVDVVADRNNLRTLLEFVQGKHVGPFRMNLHMVDNTLILERKDRTYWMRSKGTDGIGHSFETHFTKADAGLETASSYYRVIRYPLGSLNIAVRVEVDAYIDNTTYFGPYGSETDEGLDPFADVLHNISNGCSISKPRFNYYAPLSVIRASQNLPCSVMAELKTKAIKPNKGKPKAYKQGAQLWFGRTRHLFVSRYKLDVETNSNTCTLQESTYYDGLEDLKRCETAHQDSLRKLQQLL
jgi:hypothetical protein